MTDTSAAYPATAEAAEWLAQNDATHWGRHEERLFKVVEECEALQARVAELEAALEPAPDARADLKGMWGQYAPDYGPFTARAKAEWDKGRKWVFDTSHEVSEILPDGTRRKVGTFTHASDAEEAEMAVNGVRSGALVEAGPARVEEWNAALEAAAGVIDKQLTAREAEAAILALRKTNSNQSRGTK